MTHDEKLVEAVTYAIENATTDNIGRAALDAINAAGYAVVPIGDILAFRNAGMAVRRAAREADNAFSVAGIIAARFTASKEQP